MYKWFLSQIKGEYLYLIYKYKQRNIEKRTRIDYKPYRQRYSGLFIFLPHGERQSVSWSVKT